MQDSFVIPCTDDSFKQEDSVQHHVLWHPRKTEGDTFMGDTNAPSTLLVDEGTLEQVIVQSNVLQMRRETIPGGSVRSILPHFVSFLKEDCMSLENHRSRHETNKDEIEHLKIEMHIAPSRPHDVMVDLSQRPGKLESKRASVKHAALKERHLDVSEEKCIDDNQSV